MIFAGIEGGGSNTRLMIQRDAEEPSYHERAVSIKVQDGDFAESASKLLELLKSVSQDEMPNAIAIGLSGMSRTENQEQLMAAIHAMPELATAKLHIEGDGMLTLKAAIPDGREGILLIIGTGSVVYYRTPEGQVNRIGGWGPLLSDDGSGYRIGIRALRRYINFLDGLNFSEPMLEAIAQTIPAAIKTDRAAIAERANSDVQFVAGFAKLAFDLAAEDHNARHLIWEELFEVPNMIAPILASNVLGPNRPYTLYLAGSIAKHPFNYVSMREEFDESDIQFAFVDDLAPCQTALEIARSL